MISATSTGLGGLGDIDQLVDRADRLPEVRRVDDAVGVRRPRRGLDAADVPLLPPIGGILYWLRPGTIRLPPFPERVPLTRGSRRTLLDVALYAGVLASAVYLLLRRRSRSGLPRPGAWTRPRSACCSAPRLLLGLRDKVSFLCARPEIYGLLLIVFLFPIGNLFVASQLVLVLHLVGRGRLEAQQATSRSSSR